VNDHFSDFRSAFKAQPNPAHHALAWFSIPQNRLSVAPNSESFDIITQNVDGLSYKAAHISSDPDATAKCIIEMHGAIRDTMCTTCGHRETNMSSPICPALAGTETRLFQPDENEEKIPMELLPRCNQPGCGGLLRPAVVWFGESIDLLEPIEELVQQADMCLVIGTSSTASTILPSTDGVNIINHESAMIGLPRSRLCGRGPRKWRKSRCFQFGPFGGRRGCRLPIFGSMRGNFAERVGYSGGPEQGWALIRNIHVHINPYVSCLLSIRLCCCIYPRETLRNSQLSP
jgi:NAD-dependent SIR2 family protein deacetylase